MQVIFVLLFVLYGGFVSRWQGGGFFHAPKALINLAWAAPIAMVCALVLHSASGDSTMATAAFFVVTALCVAGKGTGHGQYMSLGRVVKYMEPERLDFIVRLFYGRDPRTLGILDCSCRICAKERLDQYGHSRLVRRCLFGLSVIGMAAVFGGFAALVVVKPLAARALLFAGVTKAYWYWGGWCIQDGIYDGADGVGTAIGETLSGAAVYLVIGLICVGAV